MVGSNNNSPEKSVTEQSWYKTYASEMKEANQSGWHPQPDPGQGKIISLKEAEELQAELDAAKAAAEESERKAEEAVKEACAAANSYPSAEVPTSGNYVYAPMAGSGSYPGLYAAVTSGAVYATSGAAYATSGAAYATSGAAYATSGAAYITSGSYGSYLWAETTSGSGAYIWKEAVSGSYSTSGSYTTSGSGSGSGILGYGLGLI